MIHLLATPLPPCPQTSPLLLSDRLIALAQDAERAGFRGTAAHLVDLACAVFDEAADQTRASVI